MDRFLAPHTAEALAHAKLMEEWLIWDIDQPSLDENLVARCASYQAFQRYISGEDLIIRPRSRSDLEHILRRYACDSIHNVISRSRSVLQTGGYSRTCSLAEQSIRNVLGTSDNTPILLSWHRPNRPPVASKQGTLLTSRSMISA
ncbi:hypothetical protein HYDPIDRAFT_78318 [Hydnomerulius pinastri MD-312]|nr:hypothetical protein HYDPIDRAFT_78318 [Hydnomerulius pinastri MD-312]